MVVSLKTAARLLFTTLLVLWSHNKGNIRLVGRDCDCASQCPKCTVQGSSMEKQEVRQLAYTETDAS